MAKIKRRKSKRESEVPTPIDGRDIHAIAMAMVRMVELFEHAIPHPMAPAEVRRKEQAVRYLAGRWKRRSGDHVQAVDPSGDLRSVSSRRNRHQGAGQESR